MRTPSSRSRKLTPLMRDGLALVSEIAKNVSDSSDLRDPSRHSGLVGGLICDRPRSLWGGSKPLFA
jgi:hypothetical protein